MVFRVIQGGLTTPSVAEEACDTPTREDVHREAVRRLSALHYEGWKRREAAGIAIPREVRYLAMQIEFAARAIAELSRIPTDFRSDSYWPAADTRLASKTGP